VVFCRGPTGAGGRVPLGTISWAILGNLVWRAFLMSIGKDDPVAYRFLLAINLTSAFFLKAFHERGRAVCTLDTLPHILEVEQ
jgi:hypothetical protein